MSYTSEAQVSTVLPRPVPKSRVVSGGSVFDGGRFVV